MKRWITLCLSLLLLVTLSACGKVSETEQITTEQITEDDSGMTEIGTDAKESPDAVTVSTVAELLEAIAPDSYIILAPGTYNFSTITEEEIAGCSSYVDKEYLLNYENFVISDVTGLTLEAAEDGKVELVTNNGGASVLEIRKSDNVTLRGLTCGHEVERGKCSGGVLYAEDCKNLTIEECRLYGCGTDGIWTQRVDGLTVTDTEIYECSESVFSLEETGAIFDRCRFHDNYSNILFYFSEGTDILVKDTEIYDNQGYLMFDAGEGDEDTDNRHITFRNCIFRDNRRIDRAPDSLPWTTFENCEFPDVPVLSAAGTPYEELVERFYSLVADPYGMEDIAEYGEFGVIESARAMEDTALDGMGYTIEDLSGDGIPELVVGTLPEYGGRINAVYTLVDDQPQLVFEGWYRSSYSYLGDGCFYFYGANSASETGQGYFTISQDGTALNCEEFYFTHASEEDYSELKVYYNTSGSWDITESQESDMSLEMLWEYEPSYEKLLLTSFADHSAYRVGQNLFLYNDNSSAKAECTDGSETDAQNVPERAEETWFCPEPAGKDADCRIEYENGIILARRPYFTESDGIVTMQFNAIDWYCVRVIRIEDVEKYFPDEDMLTQSSNLKVFRSYENQKFEYSCVFVPYEGSNFAFLFETDISPEATAFGFGFSDCIHYYAGGGEVFPDVEPDRSVFENTGI